MKSVSFLITPGGGPGILPEVSALTQSKRIKARIILGDADPAVGNLYLPEIDAVYKLPFSSNPGYLDALVRLIRRENVRYFYSGLDEELPLLSRNRALFEDHGCKILLPDADALECAVDKGRMWERLEGIVRMPQTFVLDETFDADKVFDAVDGKPLIKAAALRGGRSIFIPEDREEFDFYIRRARRIATEKSMKFLVQKRIDGNEFNVTTLHGKDGNPIYAISRRKFEQRQIKSTTTAAVIEKRQDVIDLALDSVKGLGLTPGFNNSEIIVSHDDDRPYLIEINGGRTAAQDQNVVSAGINITDLMIDILEDRPVSPVPHPEDGLASLKIRKDVIVPYKTIAAIPTP